MMHIVKLSVSLSVIFDEKINHLEIVGLTDFQKNVVVNILFIREIYSLLASVK